MIGKRVLIRANSAGVHFGILLAHSGQQVHLAKARRLWKWGGALSLSEVASKGVTLRESKISESVEEIILTTAIEIIPLEKKCNLPE